MVLLPFDAHNHVHMGPSPPGWALGRGAADAPTLSGMAIMSTQPSDYAKVMTICKELEGPTVNMIPCLGVHPWWAHTLTEKDWAKPLPPQQNSPEPTKGDDERPNWILDLEAQLLQDPSIPVGEIGLDKFHFDGASGELTCPMDQQIKVFEHQLELATKLQRPVSIHCVHAAGPLMDSLNKVQKGSREKDYPSTLPPALYFHAFGGKPALVDQLEAICCGRSKKRKTNPSRIYFGVAPVINFRSPNITKVVQKVGIERLVLETDHEDAARVPESMATGVEFLSQVLDVRSDELIERCNRNAMDLYRGHLL